MPTEKPDPAVLTAAYARLRAEGDEQGCAKVRVLMAGSGEQAKTFADPPAPPAANPSRFTPNLTALFQRARNNSEDTSTHGLIADALDEEHPGSPIPELIRKQFGFGVHGGKGEQESLDEFAPFFNSFDGTFPHHAPLGSARTVQPVSLSGR